MELLVNDPWFTHIAAGRKRVEGRPGKDKYFDLRKGDLLTFRHSKDTSRLVRATVLGVRRYRTWKEYLEQEGLRRTLPRVGSIDEGVAVYRQFYDAAVESRYGVAAIRFRLVP